MMTNEFMTLLGAQNFSGKPEGEKLSLIEDYRSRMNKIFDAMSEEVFPIQERAYAIRAKLCEEISFPKSKKINSNEYNFISVTLKECKAVNGKYPDIGISFTDDKEFQLTFALRNGDDNNHDLSEAGVLRKYVDGNLALKSALEKAGLTLEGTLKGSYFASPLSRYSNYDDVKAKFMDFSEAIQSVLEMFKA